MFCCGLSLAVDMPGQPMAVILSVFYRLSQNTIFLILLECYFYKIPQKYAMLWYSRKKI
jgi:hypothetical protein